MNRPIVLVSGIVSALAVAVWLGGLVALGAITAPVVFAVAPMPQSADAMTLVFRRFDVVAMTCAALALLGEAVRALDGRALPSRPLDVARASVTALAAALATYEGSSLSPRIAGLHGAGAIRGVGVTGVELSRLHDLAEACGKAQVALLAALVALQVLSWASASRQTSRRPAPPAST